MSAPRAKRGPARRAGFICGMKERSWPPYRPAVDGLVNAAGGATVGNLMHLDKAWLADFDLKLLSYLCVIHATAKIMREHGGGKIVDALVQKPPAA